MTKKVKDMVTATDVKPLPKGKVKPKAKPKKKSK
jgi:hypothetical protein